MRSDRPQPVIVDFEHERVGFRTLVVGPQVALPQADAVERNARAADAAILREAHSLEEVYIRLTRPESEEEAH